MTRTPQRPSEPSLFDPDPGDRPLAERMRPTDLSDLVGQDPVVGPDSPLRRAIERDDLRSWILWGPPGSGKTSLARILSRRTRAEFVPFSAVLSGIREVREVMQRARAAHRANGRPTLVFIDEIHRFNKAQQDAFLPFVEEGTVVLIGATTQNPSFEITPALLSRSRVVRLQPLDEETIVGLLQRALDEPGPRGLGDFEVPIERPLVAAIAAHADGDARRALNLLEEVVLHAAGSADAVTEALIGRVAQGRVRTHDRAEDHFNLISALHKSMRSSDPDATLYWLARWIDVGEDPLYAARRIVRCASEDVGLADPRALEQALAAERAVRLLGLPEGDLALAQAALYCALAPKSDALYRGWKAARQAVSDGPQAAVPLALRNAPTGLMKREGYGRGYEHAHACPDGTPAMGCLPESLARQTFYEPGERGFEETLRARLQRRRQRRGRPASD